MRSVFRLGGVCTLAGGSFLLGTQIGDDLPSVFRRVHNATAIQPVPVTAIPMPGTVDVPVSRASQIMQHGYPGFDNLRTFEDFVLSYDRKTRTAHWVCEHLTPDRLVYDASVDRAKCAFKPDESMHKYFQSQNKDYLGSGYDRGHLAAAGNHRRSQSSVDQTFFLSNMSPQVGRGFNRDKWNDVEKHTRKQAKKNLNTYILTGPLYMPRKEEDGNKYVKYKVLGDNNVAVPTHFFKILLLENAPGSFEMECYLLPNEAIPDTVPISAFLVPKEMIEIAAGFLCFDKLPKGSLKKLNGKKVGGLW